eukprot:XP_014780489.1 PREDICTED: uncharacterized protein LOC106876448 isoform X1 [Octopus bimaculoides]
MKSVVYLVTVAVIFLLEEIDGKQIQTSSNLTCALVPGRSKSIYYEPIWDYIWIRRSCMFGRVFSDRYCACIPTLLMIHTRQNTPNTCIFRGSKTYIRRADPKDSYYQERVKTRKWGTNTCKSGLVFSPTHCRCIENSHETCQYPGANTRTRKRDTDVNYFQQLTNSNTWERIKCYNGATFSLTKCYCTIGVIVTTPEPENTKICKHPKYGYFRKSDSNPQYYFQINSNNAWEKKTCAAGGTFSSAICDCTYVKPTSESEVTPKVEPELPQKFCRHVPSYIQRRTFRDERYYYELRGSSWKLIACQNGYIFSHDKCCCVSKSNPETEPTSKPETEPTGKPETEPTGKPETEPTGEPEAEYQVCGHKPSQSIRRATTKPQIYERMIKEGKWVKISCETGSRFNIKKCCCVSTGKPETEPTGKPETEPTGKPETEPTSEPEAEYQVCGHKPSQSIRRATPNRQIYERMMKGGKWVKISCEAGSRFNIKKCCCVSTGTTPAQPEGENAFSPKFCLDKSSNKRRGTFRDERHYYELRGSSWKLRACQNGYIFSHDKCCCVSKSNPETEPTGKPETEPTGKPETEPTAEPEAEYQVCGHKPSRSIRRATTNPQIYERMTKGGKWVKISCEAGSRFNDKKCCCVSTGKPETEPTGKPEHFSICPYPPQSIRRATANPQVYEQMTQGNKWVKISCEAATRFDSNQCRCIPESKPEITPVPTYEVQTTQRSFNTATKDIICHDKEKHTRKTDWDLRYYSEKISGTEWRTKLCDDGGVFNLQLCCCVFPAEIKSYNKN